MCVYHYGISTLPISNSHFYMFGYFTNDDDIHHNMFMNTYVLPIYIEYVVVNNEQLSYLDMHKSFVEQ